MSVALELVANTSTITSELLGEAAARAVEEIRPQQGFRAAIKRGFDVSAVLAGMIVALPLMLVVAVVIKLQDRGPVLFRQTRVGHEGQLFTIFKFRTMVVDAERRLAALASSNESAQHLFKMKHDPRITPIGRVLRRLSLDELPQLLNVLNGTMSLVGPRPHLPAEVAAMSPDAQRRALVKPGITGLWQISGRSNLDEAASVALDLRYVAQWSLLLDLRILFGTVSAVLSARGAH